MKTVGINPFNHKIKIHRIVKVNIFNPSCLDPCQTLLGVTGQPLSRTRDSAQPGRTMCV